MILSQVPIWSTCRGGMHVTLALAREHGAHREPAPVDDCVSIVRITSQLIGAVDLSVPKSWHNAVVRWEHIHGVTSGCCTRTL
jgi:hypothetical protein